MRIEPFSFVNRHGLKIVGDIHHPDNSKGLAFVQHGLMSARNRPHIKLLADALCNNNYMTITFDCTNSFGESDGPLRDARQTSYIEDLEDVISYIQKTPFYHEPFILTGHSMGGLSALYLAIKYTNTVKAAAALSSVLSGKLRLEAYERFEPQELQEWKEHGFLEREDRFNPGVKDILPWALMEDYMRYDVLADYAKINCPIFLAVGEDDLTSPVYQQQMLFDKLLGPKELHILPNCAHTFREPAQLAALETAFTKWLATLD